MVLVRLIKRANEGEIGDIINYSKGSAKTIVDCGLGVYHSEEENKQVSQELDLEIKEHFDKYKEERPDYVLILPGEEKNTSLPSTYFIINPYVFETIDEFLESKKIDESKDRRLERIIRFFVKAVDEKRLTVLLNHISSKYEFDKKIINSVLKRTKAKIIKERQIKEGSVLISEWTDYFSLVDKLWEIKPFFYDEQNMWWEWDINDTCWKMTDEVNLMCFVDECLKLSITATSKFKAEILEIMKRAGRKKKPKEAPKKWIQFKDKAFSLTSHKIHDVTPDYFFTNPIPWELKKSLKSEKIDILFHQWVGDKYVDTLYEIIAYCCYTDYPIHRIFALVGCGRNGKSCFQRLLKNFLGLNNVCATELDYLLSSRFESAKLYKKLACLMGETNFGVMNKTSLLKKLSGKDLIGFEFKNKTPFEDYNYATMLINSNSMPSSDDTSEGFYRRWIIINFPTCFPEGKDPVDDLTDDDYCALANKITEILPKLLKRGYFTNEGTIEEKQKKYTEASNPLQIFLQEHCVEDFDEYIRYSEFYTKYLVYLKNNKKRKVSKKEFSSALENEGLEVRRTTKKINEVPITDRYVEGLRWKRKIGDFEKNDKNTGYTPFSTSFTHAYRLNENKCISGISVIFPKIVSVLKTHNMLCFDELKALSGLEDKEFEKQLKYLLSMGDIYEPKPGWYKKL